MDWIQFFTLMITFVGGGWFLYKELKEAIFDLKCEVKSMELELRQDIKTQSSRSDQLYTMFIDLLKENRKTQN